MYVHTYVCICVHRVNGYRLGKNTHAFAFHLILSDVVIIRRERKYNQQATFKAKKELSLSTIVPSYRCTVVPITELTLFM